MGLGPSGFVGRVGPVGNIGVTAPLNGNIYGLV